MHLLKFVRLSAFLLICVAAGCARQSTPRRELIWDLSTGRSIAAIDGGTWVGQPSSSDEGLVYYVKGDRSLSISVISTDKRRFYFDNVAHIYVTKRGDKIKKLDIASFGYSEQEAIQHLQELHKKWNGMGIGDINKWRRDATHERDLSPYLTVIHNSAGSEDPSISASLCYNFGDADSTWFIMVTLFWKTP